MFPSLVNRRSRAMRFLHVFLAPLVLVAVAPGCAGAQATPGAKALAARTILLPPKVVTGAQATLAVIDAAGRLLPGVAVEISGRPKGAGSAPASQEKVTTDSTGRALFLAPNDSGPVLAKIAGQGITASTMAVSGKETGAMAGSPSDPQALSMTSYPRVLAIRDRFAISGNGFGGAADADRVSLGGEPCFVAAASPVSLVVLPGPRLPIGALTLQVSASGHEAAPVAVTGVLLDFSGPAENPTVGAEGKLILHVHGSTEPLAVEVRNVSPEVIQLLHGNPQRVETSGGEENTAAVELKFLAAGNYAVTARLASADSTGPHGGN